MHFGENQLSPGSFGISPLPTAHPTILNHRWVRASSPHYRAFTLAMGSSRGFGSARCHQTPSSDSLSLRLRPLTALTSRDTEQLAGSFFNRHAVTARSCSDCSWAHGFRIFASPFRGAFHLSLTVLFAIGRRGYVALEGGPPSFPRDSSCPAVLRCPTRGAGRAVAYGTVTRSGRPSQAVRLAPGLLHLRAARGPLRWVLQPPASNARGLGTGRVWAPPRSLTTTSGISVDLFSSGY